MLAASCSLRLARRVSYRALVARCSNVGLRSNSQLHAQTSQTLQRNERASAPELGSPADLPDAEAPASRTVRVDGVNFRPNSFGFKTITTAFKGYGRIRDVRFVDGVAYVDFLHSKDAKYVLQEHQQQPFVVGQKTLDLALASPGDVPVDDVRQMLRVVGVSVGDPSVRRDLTRATGEKWQIKLASSIMEGDTEQPLGYVAFSTPLDARIAHEYFSTKYLQANIQYVDKIRDDEAFPPNHTLSISGFSGNKYELRRYFHEFRNEIQDVRRTAKHSEIDSWEFVFVQFTSIDVARRVKAMFEEKYPDVAHVRYCGA